MSAKDNVSKHQFDIEDRGGGLERYKMSMKDPGGESAYVTYDLWKTDTEDPVLEVGYLKSHKEGKGNAKKLMQNVYDSYPKHHINWGHTIHPAATNLASQFEDKYYDRTSYYVDEDFS